MNSKKKNALPWITLVVSLIPYILAGYCYIVSGGSLSENGPGSVWWLLVIYYMTIGFIELTGATLLSIISLKSGNKVISIISLTLNILHIIFILMNLVF